MYGSSAPPPPPMLNGSIPARRLQTQPQPEMPSCVQNAMMTKDKKPFTYTPCGIDLSQIKSPRMAQRISRNANMEGVSNQPKPSPLAQQNNSNAPRSPPASAMGLPVQVFPKGPPPPPPAKAHLNVSNANRSPSLPRKSNESFEPPPLGCRPEIKIPPNPMAALRKVPTPKEKNDYWVEEYKRERSKSPMVGQPDSNAQNSSMSNGTENSEQFSQSVQDFNNKSVTKPSVDEVDSPVPSNASSNTCSNSSNNNCYQQHDSNNNVNHNIDSHNDKNQTKVDSPLADQNNNHNYPVNNSVNNYKHNNSNNNYTNGNSNPISPPQRIDSPFTSSPQPNLSPVKLSPDDNVPIYVRSSQRAVSEKPQAPQPPMINLPRQSSLEQAQTPIYQRTHQNVTASPLNQFNQQNAQMENGPIYVRSFQKQQAPQPPKPAEGNVQKPLSTAQLYNSEPGRQYYQPNRVKSPPVNESQAPLANQPLPPWMTRPANANENPNWANNLNNFTSNNNRPMMVPNNNTFQQPNPIQNQNNHSMNGNNVDHYNRNANNINNGNGNQERFVAAQFEQLPTNNGMPSSPFTAQPYQNTPSQYNRVQPPSFAPTASNYANLYNHPNKFVDQGYNSVPEWDQQQQQGHNQGNQSYNNGTRVIPIQLENGHPYLSGPISHTPHVIQSDARSTPSQSKSFRVLQQITDTMKLDPAEMSALNKPAELQRAQYARPLGPNDMIEHQLRKLKLNDQQTQQQQQQPFELRFQQQFPDWVPSKPSYNVIPSMTKLDRDGTGYTDL